MTFLNPLMLLGLAAAAIPVLVHLFNLRRPRRVDFSSLAFVKELQQRTMQRVRIKQWLLLLLRVLAMACLVVAFARPTLTGSTAGAVGQRAATSTAVVVDNSLSMTLRDAQGAYVQQAKSLAAALADEMQPGDELSLLTTAGDDDPAPYRSEAAAREAAAAITVQPGAQTLAASARRAARLLGETQPPRGTVYLLSDAQRSTLTDSLAEGLAESGVRVHLLPVGERAHANVAVTGVEVESRIVEVGQPAQLRATLANFSDEPLGGYVASVFLEDERVAQATVDLEPNSRQTVAFTATPQQRGWLAGRVEIEGDDFEPDDARYFVLHVPAQRRLLVVRGEGQTTRYVELALSPDLTGGRVAFDTEMVPEGQLAGTALGSYDAVVLVGPETLSSGERGALTRYVEAGGGLLLFPGEGANLGDYNALLGALGGGQAGGFIGQAGGERPVAGFERVDREHPLFEGVFDRASEDRQVEAPDLFYVLDYTPRSGTEQTLIEMTGGRPFLQEIRHGRGAALVMAVAPDRRWSDLPVRGLFIPLLYRSAYYLSAGEQAGGESLVAGARGELRVAGASGAEGEPLRLVGPVEADSSAAGASAAEFTPEQRDVFGGVLLQTSPDMRTPGVYDVRQGDRLVRRVALNLDARESDPAAYAPGEAAERLSEALGTEVDVLETSSEPRDVRAALAAGQQGTEIWNVFLMLALLFLVAEMLVARRWRPEAS